MTPLGRTFTYSQARSAGWSKRALYSSRDAGEIETIGRGLYRWAGQEPGALALIEVAHRSPVATICLTSALARHDLTEENPPRIDLALPRRARPPRTKAPVRWHRFANDTFELGRTTIGVDGETMGLYSAERSIVDAFRLRHLVGDDLAVEGLRRWLRRRRSTPAVLLDLARSFPSAEGPIRPGAPDSLVSPGPTRATTAEARPYVITKSRRQHLCSRPCLASRRARTSIAPH